jgi:YhcH/YjgK/YiaL family protein
MIIDVIDSYSRYRSLGAEIEKALEYLAVTDFATVEDGKHEIDGDEIYALIMSYDTEPEGARSFEAHRKHLDVQYLLSGREVIYWAPIEQLTPAGEYSQEKDILFLYGEPRARLQLTPGSFAVFYPEDAHKPNCAWEDPQQVRKAVVKVRVG